MEISNYLSTVIPGCCRFLYKGYEISISTVPLTPECVVFPNRESGDVLHRTAGTAEGIRDCMRWIEEHAG